jgi:hypothetical protein
MWCRGRRCDTSRSSAPSESNPQGEEKVLGLDSTVVRDDDGLTRPFQVMSNGLDSPSDTEMRPGHLYPYEGPQCALASTISIHRELERVELSSPHECHGWLCH